MSCDLSKCFHSQINYDNLVDLFSDTRANVGKKEKNLLDLVETWKEYDGVRATDANVIELLKQIR